MGLVEIVEDANLVKTRNIRIISSVLLKALRKDVSAVDSGGAELPVHLISSLVAFCSVISPAGPVLLVLLRTVEVVIR